MAISSTTLILLACSFPLMLLVGLGIKAFLERYWLYRPLNRMDKLGITFILICISLFFCDTIAIAYPNLLAHIYSQSATCWPALIANPSRSMAYIFMGLFTYGIFILAAVSTKHFIQTIKQKQRPEKIIMCISCFFMLAALAALTFAWIHIFKTD